MEQHPVPQHIASFQFKLFGNLTARQFITLAIPLALAAAVFFSGLAAIIRLPLALVIGLIGFFVALVPVGGRPFEKWFVAFIKAIFTPTQRIWIKETALPEFLNIVVTPTTVNEEIPQEITEQGRERLFAYLKSLPKDNESPLDTREDMAISQLNFTTQEMGVGSVPPPIIWPSQSASVSSGASLSQGGGGLPRKNQKVFMTEVHMAQSPAIKPFEEKKGEAQPKLNQIEHFPQQVSVGTVRIQEHAKKFTLSGIEDRLSDNRPQFQVSARPMSHLASDTNFYIDNIISLKQPDNRIRLVRGVGKTRVRKLHFAPPANFDLSKLPIRGERRFEISNELKRRFNFEDDSPQVVLPSDAVTTVRSDKVNPASSGSAVSQVLPKQEKSLEKPVNVMAAGQSIASEVKKTETTMEPRFSITDKKTNDSARVGQGATIIPLTSTPNVLSGLVTDNGGVPLEGAVLVVRDATGIPIRALKTNKLGQFLSATPLNDGQYVVEVESDKALFNPISISLSGQVLAPLGLMGEGKNG